MTKKITYSILFVSLLLCACNRQKKQQSRFYFQPPEVVKANGNVVPQDKMAPPEITPAKEIKRNATSKPKVINLNSNVYPVGKPVVVPAGSPKICTPGQNGFALPKILPAIDSPFKAGIPEVTIAKDPQVKDNNPASFSTFKVLHGLKSKWVIPIIQDKAGNLWIACYEGGVSKYDGRYFTNYTAAQGLSNDNVSSMLEDSKGNLWFGYFDGGLNKFDGKSITRYKTEQGLSDNTVMSILEDRKGNLWFGTHSDGVIKYDGKTFTHYTTKQGLPGNQVRSIIEDSKGNLWFGTNSGASKYNGKSFSNYTTDQGMGNADIICIMEDSKGNFWISTIGGGVNKYDGRVFEHYSVGQGLPGGTTDQIAEDISGNLWFTTQGAGVIRYDGKSFTQFSVEQGLSDNGVNSVREDKNGNLWFGTNDGLSRYNGKTFTHFNSSLGFGEGSYHTIYEDKTGNIWAGVFGFGVNRFDGKSVAHYTIDQGLSNISVMCVLKDGNGNLWVGTNGGGGVNKFDGNSFSQFENFPLHTNVWSMLEDTKGNIWFGTSKGLYKYDGKNFTHFGIAQGLSQESISSICEDRNGNLWLGTDYDGVVNKLNLSAAETGRYSFMHYNINRSTSVSIVYSILEDKHNNLWFGINNAGVIKFDGKFFTRYTTSQGLSNNSVNSMVEDKEGNMWFLTSDGLCKMKSPRNDKAEKTNPDTTQIPLFTNYLYADGFLGVGSQLNSMILGRDGKIWMGAGNRVTCYHPEGDIPDTIPPTIKLSGVALFDEKINWLELEKKKDTTLILGNGTRFRNFNFSGLTSWYNQPENLQLAYNNNYITFQFIGITTNRPKQVRYKFFLEGLDENWSSITDKPEVTYNALPNGTYTFKVKAVNSEGFWSNEAAYTFTILPPWWKTWWFRTLAVVFLILVIYAIIQARSRSLNQRNKQLEEKVTVRTKELKHSLEELKSTQAQLVQQEKMASLGELTAGIAHEIQNPLNFVNNFSEVNIELTNELKDELNKIEIAAKDKINLEVIVEDIVQNEQKINHHGRRADNIVKGMLQHSRISTGQKELTDMNALAEECLRLSYYGLRAKDKSFNAEIKTDLDESLGKINIVPEDIGRVLINIINNAFYAVTEKKKKPGGAYEPIVSISTKKIVDKIEIRIKDNGTGIPQKVMDKIFQPFFTTKPTGQGTGLGLSLSYDVIKAHGGQISVESKEEEGTMFRIELPV